MSKILKGHQVQALKVEFRESETFSALKEFFYHKEVSESQEPLPSLNEEIEKLKKQVYEESYQEGYQKGYQEGYQEGFDKGHTEGFEKGYAEGRIFAEKELSEAKTKLEEEYQEKLKALEGLLSKLRKTFSESILNLDQEVLAIVEKISEKFLFKALEEDKELILRVIREALKEVVEGAQIVIKVHPKEAEILEKIDLASLSEKNFPKIEIKPDPGVSLGGCLLETSFGLVDATVERRWEEIFKALEEASSSEG